MRASRSGWTIITLILVLGAGRGRQGQSASKQVSDTRFNYKRGFYTDGFTVLIRSKTTGARIRYTIDGSAPTPTKGLGDANPVAVPIRKTTTLRAVAYKEGMFPSNVDTQTYIFIEDVLKQPASVPGYPSPQMRSTVHETIPLDYEMDPAIVENPRYRLAIRNGLRSIPTISLVMDRENLFRRVPSSDGNRVDLEESGVYWGESGIGSTRPVSMELIDPRHPERDFQADAGLEGHSWRLVKRAFRLKFQKEYGPAKLVSTVFQDAPLNGDAAANTFDRIVLRSGKNRSWAVDWDPGQTCYARDQWARDTQVAMSGVGAHGTFVHLYLNGLYWGLYNACERPDEWFVSTYFGGEVEDWSSINHDGPRQGDPSRWHYLIGALKERDMSVATHYEELRQYLDVTRFADYIILCWYMGTDDWPHNNWYAAYRVNPASPLMFFIWDAENIWDTVAAPAGQVHPRFRAAAKVGTPDMVGVWHSLRKSSDFMMLFADRVYEHCFNDGALTEENATARWQLLNDHIADAVVAESARWGDSLRSYGAPTRTRDETFRPEVSRVAELMTGNNDQFIDALRAEGYYPGMDPPQARWDASSLELLDSNEVPGRITTHWTVEIRVGREEPLLPERSRRVRVGLKLPLAGLSSKLV